MYFITGIEDFDKDYGVKGSRCFGYYSKFEEADSAVRHNSCDINETIYDYAVIELLVAGIHSICFERYFYKFDYDKRIYEPIDEPEEVKHFCNFSIG